MQGTVRQTIVATAAFFALSSLAVVATPELARESIPLLDHASAPCRQPRAAEGPACGTVGLARVSSRRMDERCGPGAAAAGGASVARSPSCIGQQFGGAPGAADVQPRLHP